MSRRGTAAVAVIAAATTALHGLAWALATPALLGLPAELGRDNVVVSGGMALVVLMITGVVNVLYRMRWRRRRPAELPVRQLLAGLFACVVAVGVAWAAALHRFEAPYGAALTVAHLGAGVLVSLVAMGVAFPLLRSETVRQVSGIETPQEALGLSWSRVRFSGYLLLVVMLFGVGTTCMVVSYKHVQAHREFVSQRERTSATLLDLLARRVERVPRTRILSTVGRARLPSGYVVRVVTREGRYFRGDPSGRAPAGDPRTGRAPVLLGADGRCEADHQRVGSCRWAPLRLHHEELALVAFIWPVSSGHSERSLWTLAAFALMLTFFSAVVAYLMGRDVSQELDEVASRVRSMAERPDQGLGEPLHPTSSDEMGELLGRFGELRQTLAGQLAVSARDVHRSAAVDRAKTAFLEEVNFALRTPLTSVIGYAELLEEGAYGELTADQAQEVQITLESSEQLLGLVQDIVDVSFAEAGGIQLRLEAADLGALVRSEIAAARSGKRGDAVSLRRVVPEDLPSVVLDSVRIRRVVANLLSNAIKFTTVGEIVVTVSDPVDGRIEVGVRDTGLGIAPEHQSLIFEQYRQAPQARPKQLRGSGLGLAIVQQLVRLHGGRVWLESTPGEGSEFFFSLPIRGPDSVSDGDMGESEGSP